MVEVSKSKSISKYLQSKIFLTIEQESIVRLFVKRGYFFKGHPVLFSKKQIIAAISNYFIILKINPITIN